MEAQSVIDQLLADTGDPAGGEKRYESAVENEEPKRPRLEPLSGQPALEVPMGSPSATPPGMWQREQAEVGNAFLTGFEAMMKQQIEMQALQAKQMQENMACVVGLVGRTRYQRQLCQLPRISARRAMR